MHFAIPISTIILSIPAIRMVVPLQFDVGLDRETGYGCMPCTYLQSSEAVKESGMVPHTDAENMEGELINEDLMKVSM